ncbi:MULTISPECIES: methylenetetrahydrofolate reductase [unclassified Campylobacter]|uniref:methylenetetrahydrofolate reductase n=1 Tax=unclassified Campylobacter TaxID=2593542 RepID=UPI003D32883F
MLEKKILNKEKGLVLYALTPPKAEFEEAKLREISNRWTDRINDINADGLVLYEVQDESERNESERTFEFSGTLSPQRYYSNYLNVSTKPVFYRVAGAYDESSFRKSLKQQSANLNVLVGATHSHQSVSLSLQRAYEIACEFDELVVGGVCISERHAKKGDEVKRMRQKLEMGVKFFISQAIFDIELTHKFLASCATAKIDVPIFLTFSTAGNPKTLEFIKWLGVSVPTSIENRLNKSSDYLNESVQIIKEIYSELREFGDKNGLNLGLNIESVMAKRAEIEASLALCKQLKNTRRLI